jgi:hypothetical protein
MKTIRIFSVITLLMAITASGFAQTSKTETLKIAGECGMCKKKIEKAAKEAGAVYALWNKDTKILTIKYSSSTTNTAKIEQKIAGVGYDTPNFKATDEAYNELDECCKYEREVKNVAVENNDNPGVGATLAKMVVKGKDGKMNCSPDKSCCKDSSKDCCKDGSKACVKKTEQ